MRDNKLIQFYLTNQCNSRCSTCTIWANKETEELHYDDVISVIKDFPNADYVFGGGEFTMYSHIGRLLDFCDTMGTNYTILSNAVNLGWLQKVMIMYKVPNLTISCDGINHDHIRGIKGNLDNVKKVVKEYKGKTNLKLSYTYSKHNQETFKDDMEMFKELGFDKVYLCLAQDVGLLNQNDNKSFITSNFKQILEYSDMFYDKDIKFVESIIYDMPRICNSVKSVHTVYSNGDVIMCQSYMSKRILGNIYNKSFKDIIKEFEMERLPKCTYDNECNLLCQRRYD